MALPPKFFPTGVPVTNITAPYGAIMRRTPSIETMYTDWKPKFVFFPVTTISKKKYWLSRIYKRTKIVQVAGVARLTGIAQYGDLFDITAEDY